MKMKGCLMKKKAMTFVYGILAGISIGIGSLAFVVATMSECGSLQKLIGSALFSVGLLCVCSFAMFLYTGKIGYAIDNKPAFLSDLAIGLAGNFVGAVGFGYLCGLVPGVKARAEAIAASRDVLSGGEQWWMSLVLGVICGMLVFLAVDVFKRKPGAVGALGLVLAVTTFVFVGSEHCIANMAYFSMANHWTAGTLCNTLLVALGNSLGALLLRSMIKFCENGKILGQ
jgi:formate/nitrite transporter FocA (FNT family)